MTHQIIAQFTHSRGISNFYKVEVARLTPALVEYFTYKATNSPEWVYFEGDFIHFGTPQVGGNTCVIEERTSSTSGLVYANFAENLSTEQRIAQARVFRAEKSAQQGERPARRIANRDASL